MKENILEISNVLISDSWGEIEPSILNKGVGGREGALLYLSREWAKRGHNVTNFVNVQKPKRFYENELIDGTYKHDKGYHEYIPLNATKSILGNIPHNAVIAWECPTLFNDETIREQTGVKLCEMQVAHLSEKETMAGEQYCDYICALSDWHGDFLVHSGFNVPREKVKTLPNGVDISRYPLEQVEAKYNKPIGDNPKFVYSSSPDRGLWYLLQIWPQLRKKYKNATLSICYGTEQWTNALKWSHGRIGEMALEIENLLKQPGIKNLGKIGQDRLATLQLEADAWLYPFDPMSPTETGCITAVENAAAGNPIFTTDADCMDSEFGEIGNIIPLPIEVDRFVENIIDVLEDTDYLEYQRRTARKFAEERDWGLISKKWEPLFVQN